MPAKFGNWWLLALVIVPSTKCITFAILSFKYRSDSIITVTAFATAVSASSWHNDANKGTVKKSRTLPLVKVPSQLYSEQKASTVSTNEHSQSVLGPNHKSKLMQFLIMRHPWNTFCDFYKISKLTQSHINCIKKCPWHFCKNMWQSSLILHVL